MVRRIGLIFSVFLAACGGSTSDGGVADAGQDGTADAVADVPADVPGDVGTDAPKDTATPPDTGGDDAILPDGACADCVASAISFGYSGGLVAYVDSSSISPCRTYLHERRTPGSPSTLKASCTLEVEACVTGGNTVEAVNAALADADVQAALAKAPILYGVDPRAFDGAVYDITVGGKTIEVGTPCTSGASGCVPIPAGVQKAVDFFRAFDTAQLATSACAGKFTP